MKNSNLEHFITKSELYFLEFSIISFRNYFSLVENNLQENHKKLLKEYHKITRKLQDENYKNNDLEHMFSSISESLNEVEIGYIQRFRYSNIIQLYSFLEAELTNLCEIHYEENSKEYKVSDLRGNNDLDKIKKYLETSANRKVTENKLWLFINDLRKLRNCIVHSNGLIKETDNDYNSIKKFSENNFKLRGTTKTYLIKLDNPKFIELCLNNIEKFLLTI